MDGAFPNVNPPVNISPSFKTVLVLMLELVFSEDVLVLDEEFNVTV